MSSKEHKQISSLSNLYRFIVKALRGLREWSLKCAVHLIKSEVLTKLYKRVSIKIEDSMFFVWLRKQFQSIRKATVGSSSISFLNKRSSLSIRSFLMVKNRARALATLAVLSTALFLTACGGGGGGETVVTPTPTPVVPVVNPPVLSVASTSPLPVASTIVVTSDKALEGVTQVSLINQLNAAIPANAVLSADKKSIVITPIANFTYATTITVTVKAKANGVEGTVTATVITENAPVVCTPPSMANSVNVCMQPPAATGYTWNNTIKAWVANIGVLVTSLNELPLECKVIGDACWKGKTADGTIKYFETNLVMTGFSARKIVFAGLVVSKQSGFAAGNFNLIPIYVDTESDAPLLNNLVLNGSNTDGVVTLKGSQNGVKFTTPANGCWEKVWVGNGFSSATTTCPI